MTSYTQEQVTTALNGAADDILDAVGEPDTGVRDALNLLVNVALTRLDRPDASVRDVIVEGYQIDPETESGPLDWIKEAL